jgi:hypothetical protein
MAIIKMSEWEDSLEKNYQAYLASRKTIKSERYRSEDETIFEALSSKEADFTLDEEGQRLVELIRRTGGVHEK